ncbi:hypothetical protein GOBAR_AA10490 [Gossypium barbadense]|uniref:E3 ubiquitin-protein ligase RMA n=1 Tax=Gossypium barbadense TaxID=3634 RepID=A0A2P5Y3N6_GOSBA|nr:hypothetical protein GOBAR_AA10490 [Gossypium barbadense]
MAMEPNFFEQEGQSEPGNISLKHKWDSLSSPTRDQNKDSSGFDCNICFDSAQDPVVTLCGHLYCWPCIYKWLHVQTSSLDADQRQRNCPVCKANISSSSLIWTFPKGHLLFGLNPMTTSSQPSQQLHENLFHHQQYFPHPYGDYATLASSSLGGIAMTNFFNPMFGMLEEMVYARISGSSNTTISFSRIGIELAVILSVYHTSFLSSFTRNVRIFPWITSIVIGSVHRWHREEHRSPLG